MDNETQTTSTTSFSSLIKAVIVFVLFLVVIYVLKYYFYSYPTPTAKTVIVKADKLNEKIFYLPDSSKIMLHANSSISYPESYNVNNRIVNLIGDADFFIKEIEKESFILYTGESKIITSDATFSVKMNAQGNTVALKINSGNLSFTTKKDSLKNTVFLSTGDSAILNSKNNTITK